MAADAISYAVSVASLVGHPAPRNPRATRGRRADAARAEGREAGLSVRDWGTPIIGKTVACSGTVNLFGSMAGAVQINFLIRVLHVHPAYAGLFSRPASLGGISGGLLSGRTARWIGSARIIWFSLLVFGAAAV